MSPTFRPMVAADIRPALRIIAAHDRDDGVAAADTFRAQGGTEHHYVLCLEERLVGVTGGHPVEDTDHTWWLSWTYLHAAHRGRGLGRELLTRMLDALRERGARKVFLTTSDLLDQDGNPKYGKALRAYAAAGFEPEAHHGAFYTPTEAMLVLGLRLVPPVASPVEPDTRAVRLGEAHEMAETDDAYALDWRFVDAAAGDGPTEVRAVLDDLDPDARLAVIGVPSNAPHAIALAERSGFLEDGVLRDFHADGVHEVRYRLDLHPTPRRV